LTKWRGSFGAGLRSRATRWLAPALELAVVLALVQPARALEVVALVGEHDVSKGDETPIEGGFTLRFTGTEIWRSKHGVVLMPAVGAMATEQEAYYGWVGGAFFIPLGARWGLIPELGAGYYERGDGKDLGGSLEFRSGLEATYRPNDTVRVGVGFYHLSNAGLHEVNPGVNSLLLTIGFRPGSRSRVWDTAGLR
jgi:hypothetical protein